MKKEDFFALRSELRDVIRDTILNDRNNIFGEKVEYSSDKSFTSKDKKELKQVFENSIFVESLTVDNQNIIVQLKSWVPVRDLEEYIRDLGEFRETLYPSSYVFDEEESVKWNREQVEKENAEIKKRKELDIKKKELLRASMKPAIILGTIDFFAMKQSDYASVEVVYDYLKGADKSDAQIAKDIIPLIETILKYNEVAKKVSKKK